MSEHPADEPRSDLPNTLMSCGCMLMLLPVLFILVLWVWVAIDVLLF